MKKILIIAEAGVNHNGDVNNALKMIDVAKEAGADIVKFQTGKAKLVISKYAQKAEYQKKNTDSSESQLEMVQKLLLPFEDFITLKEYCEKVGIKFLSTPFDLESVEFLENIGCDIWKIPSGEVTNLPYLIKIARTKKPVIMSTGMCNLEDIENAIQVLKQYGTEEITLLHCNTEYPTPYNDVNLFAMNTLKQHFDCEVGYSDHTKGIEVAIAAAALGASVIEKHFTLDKNMEGPDHAASLEPKALKEMVSSIRNIELAMGINEKIVTESENKNRNIARKSIVAKKRIKKGEIFTEDNLTVKRPGNGINPMKWFEILGKEAIRDFEEDELIEI